MVGRRSARRVAVSLPVKVWATDSKGKPMVQTARTVDVSQTGARLEWVRYLTKPGATIEVQHRKEKSRFRVAWIGKDGTPEEGQIGIQCLEPGKSIWNVTLPAAGMDDSPPPSQPAVTPATPVVTRVPFLPSWTGEERRQRRRYPCTGGVEILQQDSETRLTGSLSDISLGGCYVETRAPLPPGIAVELVVSAHETEVRAKGEVRVSHPSLGMGIAFTEMSERERERLQQLIHRLAGGPVAEVKATPSPSNSGPAAAVEFLLELLQSKGVLTREEFLNALGRVKTLSH